uniref:Uncharacterized protein n=1 Tax=Arundo donax TaxID=35708 RepID=A0A0A8ZY08_ARUDO
MEQRRWGPWKSMAWRRCFLLHLEALLSEASLPRSPSPCMTSEAKHS